MIKAYEKLFISPEEAKRMETSATKKRHVRCGCEKCRIERAGIRVVQGALSNSLRIQRRLMSALERISREVRASGIHG